MCSIQAAARHYCKFLVNQQKEEFRSVGGDPKWLLGLEHAPAKIRNLNEINKLLAHQPWLLTKEHIAKLTKGDDSWSLSELVQAIVLLAHFHSLASFVFGCGFNDFDQSWLNTNVSTIASCTSSSTTPTATSTTTASCPTESNNLCDLLTSHTTRSTPPSPPSSTDKPLSAPVTLNAPFWTTASPQQSIGSLDSLPGQGQNSLEQLMHKMRSISEHRQQFSENDNQEELVKNQSLEIDLAGGLPTTPLKLTSSANEDENVSATPIQTGVARSSITVCSPPILSPAFSSTTLASVSSLDGANDADLELSRFVLDRKFAYVDFARQRATADITTFRVQDYSWSDHAYSLLNRFYPDVGCLLDDKFQITYNLTYFT